jgi:multisubunit Na+/H+ antiporter MnhB subunit
MNHSRLLRVMDCLVALLVGHCVLALFLYADTRDLGFAGVAVGAAAIADCAVAIQRRLV